VKGSIKEKGTIDEVELRYGSGFLIRTQTLDADLVLKKLEERLIVGSINIELKVRMEKQKCFLFSKPFLWVSPKPLSL
jgi:hypothetical protein